MAHYVERSAVLYMNLICTAVCICMRFITVKLFKIFVSCKMFICLLDKCMISMAARTEIPLKPLGCSSDFNQLYLYAVSLS